MSQPFKKLLVKQRFLIKVGLRLLLISFLSFNAIFVWGQPKEKCYIIEEKTPKKTVFSACFRSDTSQYSEYYYEFSAVKKGPNGKSKTKQQSKFAIKSGEEKKISTISLNITNKDTYILKLKIYRKTDLICSDSIVYPNPLTETL
jgi:hypothetical protein